jgi:hypothetical protein
MKLLTLVQPARNSPRAVVVVVAPVVVLVVVVLAAVASGTIAVVVGVTLLLSQVPRSWSRNWCTSTVFRRP